MQKVALTDINAWDVAWPAATGLGLGLGARLLRHGVDLKTKRGVRAPKELTQLESAQIEVPVDVSDEEANELEAKGIKVAAPRQVLPKAKATDSTMMPSQAGVTMSPAATPAKPSAASAPLKVTTAAEGLTATVLQGALGAGAAYGGWSLLDNVLDKQRLEKAKGSLQRSRERIKRLIAGDPDPSDAGVATALKVAEDLFLKQANLATSIGGAVIGGATDVMAPIGIPLGIGAALLGAKAYNESKAANKYRQRVKQISESLEREDPLPPVAVLHPVRRRKAAPSDTGVIHNPGAEPVESPEIDVKVAAEDDDDSAKWVALAIAGAAGVAGYMWIRNNPDEAIKHAPWAKDIIDNYIRPGKPLPPAEQKKADDAATAAGATPQDRAAGAQAAKDPAAPAAVQEQAQMTQAAPAASPGLQNQVAGLEANAPLLPREMTNPKPNTVAPGQTISPERQGENLAQALTGRQPATPPPPPPPATPPQAPAPSPLPAPLPAPVPPARPGVEPPAERPGMEPPASRPDIGVAPKPIGVPAGPPKPLAA